MMNLKNIWQRLWVVLSVFWLLFVVIAFLVGGMLPTAGQLETELRFETRVLQANRAVATIEAARPVSGIVEQTTTAQIRSAYEDLSDIEIVERFHSSFPEADFEPVDSNYRQKLDALQALHKVKLDGLVLAQARNIGLLSLVWLLPSVGLYLLGLAVVWVWHGFKLKGESQ